MTTTPLTWAIITVIPGDCPEDIVGPFASREAAQAFLDDDRTADYMAAMAESAIDNSDQEQPSKPEVLIYNMIDPQTVLDTSIEEVQRNA